MTVEQRNKWLIENEKFIHKVCQPYRYRYDYEDVVQEAFVGAAMALDRSDESRGEKAIRQFVAHYIDGYVMNNVIKKACPVHIPRYLYDKGARVDVLSIEWEYEDEETFESLYLGYNEPGYEEAEVLTDLQNAISGLSEKLQKTAFMLYEGYSRKDIAEQDHCSQNAIYLRIQDIKRACKLNYA